MAGTNDTCIVVWKPEYTEKVTVSMVACEGDINTDDVMVLAHEYEGLMFGEYLLYTIIKATDAHVMW